MTGSLEDGVAHEGVHTLRYKQSYECVSACVSVIALSRTSQYLVRMSERVRRTSLCMAASCGGRKSHVGCEQILE